MGRNGWVLSREIALRAQRIIALIPQPANTDAKTENEIWAKRAAELEYSRLRELAFMLCFGLVAIRRAGSNETYVGETEYGHMQYTFLANVSEEIMKTFEKIGCPLDFDEMSQRLELDIDRIRGLVEVATRDAVLGTPGRARPLIEWVASKGLVVSDVSLIKNALMTGEEWNSDSPVHAYPA